MGIVYGEKRVSIALTRLEGEFGIDTEADKGWTTWVTLVPSSSVLMRLWEYSSLLVGGAVIGVLGSALNAPIVLVVGAAWAFLLILIGLQFLASKGVIPQWDAYWDTRPAFLSINDERVVIARISPYRWSVRRVLVDESPRVGGFQFSDHHTPKRIGLAFVRPSSPPLYCQINDKVSPDLIHDLTTQFAQPPPPDTRT